MPKSCIQVTNMHGFTLEQLSQYASEAKQKYTRAMLTAVVMRLQNIHTSTIAKTLNRSIVMITKYINNWNENGLDNSIDTRGGSKSSFSQEMLDHIKNIVTNKSPLEFGFQVNNWNTHILKEYIQSKYGIEYSNEWIRQILITLGFTYKYGVYKPTKCDVELRESFKKNK